MSFFIYLICYFSFSIQGDEKQHNIRLDLHYSRREAARKQQQEKVLSEMRQQLGASDDQRDLDRLRQEKERSAAQFAARMAAESELKNHKQKRRAELEMQAELAARARTRLFGDTFGRKMDSRYSRKQDFIHSLCL